MPTSREQAVAELRRSIDVLPERTRKAMLVGIGNNTVITGAFGAGGGACPILAAHREGGRTSACSFPAAWDKFTGVAGRQIVRPATEYEIGILRREILASLETAPQSVFADAIAEHQAAVEARQARLEEERVAELELEQELAAAPPRKRRIRITGGEYIDLSSAIEEHRSTARERRSREAESTGLNWLFEETLVLPEDFETEPDSATEFDFDSAEDDLLRR